jgi:hypothetical protein
VGSFLFSNQTFSTGKEKQSRKNMWDCFSFVGFGILKKQKNADNMWDKQSINRFRRSRDARQAGVWS